MATIIVNQHLTKELEVIKTETAPVIARAATLVVQTAQDYAVADSFLDRLVGARKTVKARLARIIDPIKQALDEAKSLLKEADGPLEQSEILVREKMRTYKLEEARQARIEEQKRAEAEEKLRQEAAAKLLAESKAKTQQMRDKLAAQRAELEAKADVAAAAPAPAVVKAAGSTTRAVKVPKITDPQAVLRAILDRKIPITVVDFNLTQIRMCYKASPATVEQWAQFGIEMVDDIQIVKR